LTTGTSGGDRKEEEEDDVVVDIIARAKVADDAPDVALLFRL
jgi:hypothetical protein